MTLNWRIRSACDTFSFFLHFTPHAHTPFCTFGWVTPPHHTATLRALPVCAFCTRTYAADGLTYRARAADERAHAFTTGSGLLDGLSSSTVACARAALPCTTYTTIVWVCFHALPMPAHAYLPHHYPVLLFVVHRTVKRTGTPFRLPLAPPPPPPHYPTPPTPLPYRVRAGIASWDTRDGLRLPSPVGLRWTRSVTTYGSGLLPHTAYHAPSFAVSPAFIGSGLWTHYHVTPTLLRTLAAHTPLCWTLRWVHLLLHLLQTWFLRHVV